MFLFHTHQCSEQPGHKRRWLVVAAFVATLSGLGAQAAAAQVTVGSAGSCPGGNSMVGNLGVEFECQDCGLSYSGSTRSWRWRFGSEPTIKNVSSSGPSRGKLREGDVLVSIDGKLITTRSGGATLTQLEPGEPVVVRVRRSGRDVTTAINPAGACPTDVTGVAPLPAAGRLVPTPLLPDVPRVQGVGVSGTLAPRPLAMSGTMARTSAWFGWGLSCSHCKIYQVRHEEIAAIEERLRAYGRSASLDSDEVSALYDRLESYRRDGSRWEFITESPRIFSVDEGGPADRAGIRRGDILTHIDGLALLSDEGGKRLGQVKPGDKVEVVYRRGTAVGTTLITVGSKPTRGGVLSDQASRSRALLESLGRIERSRDPVVRDEVSRLQDQLREDERAQRAATVEDIRSRHWLTRPLRYSGTIAKVNVTVRSHASVVVSRDEETGEVVITTSDATIRVKPEE